MRKIFAENKIDLIRVGAGENRVIDCSKRIKKQDEKDRRASLISITSKGTYLVEKIFSDHINNLDKVLSILNKDEKENLISLLKKLGKAQ